MKKIIPKLSDRARARYEELAAELDMDNVVTRDRLADYCEVWDEWVTATEKLAELGAVVRQGNDIVASPYLLVRNAAAKRLEELACLLGITPAMKLAREAFDYA